MTANNILKGLSMHVRGSDRLRSVGRSIILAGTVGIVAGLGAVAFQWLCHFVLHYGLDMVAGYHSSGPAGEKELFAPFFGSIKSLTPWLLVLVPTIGGLISGLLVYGLAPETEGHGTDAAIDAYHNKRGLIRPRVPIIKMFASAITLGTGGSGGRARRRGEGATEHR